MMNSFGIIIPQKDLYLKQRLHLGTQYVYKFANGYGASVLDIEDKGLLNVAVIKWNKGEAEFKYVYNKAIGSNRDFALALNTISKL